MAKLHHEASKHATVEEELGYARTNWKSTVKKVSHKHGPNQGQRQ